MSAVGAFERRNGALDAELDGAAGRTWTSKEIRERLARCFNTGSTGAVELLAEIGRDCVGALEILPEEVPSAGTSPLQAEVLSEARIAQILRAVRRRRMRWAGETTMTSVSRFV